MDQVPLAPRRKRVARLLVEDKERILNIFQVYTRENPKRPKTEMVEFTAKKAGVSVASVFRILREYKNTHEFHPPKVLDNIDEATKSALKRLLHSFFERNEPPTLDKVLAAVHEDEHLPQMKRTTLALIKEVGFCLQPSHSTSTTPTANPFIKLEEPSCSLPSSASTSTPLTTDPFIKLEEPSCSDIQEPDVETTFELLPQLSEQPILNVAVKQNPTYRGCKDAIYCRLCLKPSNKDSLTPLNVIDINYPGKSDAFKKKKADEMKEIQKMIKFCLPFFDSLTFNPIICSICLARLRSSYDFANECLKNQRFIKKYVDVYGIIEKVVNINEIIESKFSLSDDRTSDIVAEVPTPNIPKVIKSNSRVSQQMKGEYLDDGPFKKRQKIYKGSHEEDPLTSLNEDTLNNKTKTCEDDGYASREFLIQDIQVREVDPDNVAEEPMIKIEPDYINSPVFVKPELVDGVHVENKMFNKGMGIETDIQEQQHSYSYGMTNVALDKTNVPSFTAGSVISNQYFILETVPSDVGVSFKSHLTFKTD